MLKAGETETGAQLHALIGIGNSEQEQQPLDLNGKVCTIAHALWPNYSHYAIS
jgi:hypothetical protein